MMNCAEARERFMDRLVACLTENERIAVEEHLANCGSCRAEDNTLQVLWDGLGDFPMEEPSTALRANFYHMLEAYRMGAGSVAAKSSAKHSSWNWFSSFLGRMPLSQFAAAGLALAFGLIAGHYYTVVNHNREQVAHLSTENLQMRQLVALSMLQQQSASGRLQGVSYSSRMQPAGDEVITALMQTLNSDSNVNVRLAALDALTQFASSGEVRTGLRTAMLHQDSPIVQISLIDWAVESKDGASLEYLLKMNKQQELNPSVRSRLAGAISGLQ